MNNEIAVVFGGAGFVGRYVVKRLAARGWPIRVAMRRPEEGQFLKPMGDVGQIDLLQANLRDAPSVAAAAAGATIVINLVAILFESGRQTFNDIHVRGAAHIAAAAAKTGARRLIHVSAIGADGKSPSAYGRTKALGEAEVRHAFPGATIVRPSIVFGAEDQFFNRFAAMARLTPVLPLVGGTTRFQPIYVGDVAAAIMAMLDDAATAGTTFELGGPRIYTFAELMRLMLRVIGRRRLLLPLPFPLALAMAAFLEWLPNPLLTRDQVRMLRQDNVVGPGARGLAELGLAATSVEGTIESYLHRFRRAGIIRAS